MEVKISDQICKQISGEKMCTAIGQKIADSLIKNFSTQIFNKPEQSFLELCIDSINSYQSGIGFFSLFYWIMENPRRTLDLTTRGYKIRFTYIAQELVFTKMEDGIQQGTLIELNCQNAPLSQSNMYNINEQLNRLFDIKNVGIYLNNQSINNRRLSNNIFIQASSEKVTFFDNTKEMPFPIIPSYSVENLNPEIEKFPSLVYGTRKFIITVNDIAIITLSKVGEGLTFIIRLPNNTNVPISRDDIIYTGQTIAILKHQLLELLAQSIEKYSDITELLDMLDYYGKYSNQKLLLDMIVDLKNEIYTIFTKDIIFVPVNPIYNYLRKLYPQVLFVNHPNPDILETEKHLDTLLKSKEDIFLFKKVVVLNLPSEIAYSTGDLFKYLFINKDYERNTLVSLCKESLLLTVSPDFMPDIQYPVLTSNYNLVMNFITTMMAKLENIIIRDVEDPKTFFLGLLDDYYTINPSGIEELVIYFNGKLARISFDYSYGTDPLIIILGNFVLFDDKLPQYNTPISEALKAKITELNIQIGYWFLSLWPFEPSLYYNMLIHFPIEFQKRFAFHPQSDAILIGLSLCINEVESLVYLNIMYLFDGDFFPGIGEYCLQEIRKRASLEELTDMAISSVMRYADEHNIYDKIAKPTLEALSLYENLPSSFPSSSIKKKEEDIKGYEFTCKQLIAYVFKNETVDYSKVNTMNPADIKLPILETKDYIQSIMTELFRNSLDAINSSEYKNSPIKITITANSISFMNMEGIPDNEILALLIPFLSRFSDIYRKAVKVVIDTVYNKKKTIIQGIPLNDDIKYTLSITENTNEPNNTIITIFLPEEAPDAKIFATNYLGFTDIPVYVNDVLIKQNITKIYTTDLGDVYLTDSPTIPSYIMINDVPFAPLDSFAIQFPLIYHLLLNACATRVIINFNIFPSMVRGNRDVTIFINNGLFLAVLEMYNRNEIRSPDDVINNTTSTKNIRQLYFLTNSDVLHNAGNPRYSEKERIPDFYIRYLFSAGINIRSIINQNIIDIEDGKELKYDDSIISRAVQKWFSNKQTNEPEPENITIIHTQEIPSFPTVEEERDETLLARPFDLLQPFIDLYWDIYKTLLRDGIIKGPTSILNKPPPQILIGDTKNEYEGYYDMDKHIIFLSKSWYNLPRLTTALREIRIIYKSNKDEAFYYFRIDKDLQWFFSPVLPASTLIHELLHAVQVEEHGVNDHHIATLIINGQSHFSFDGCAIEVYQEILKRNIIDKYLKI